MSSKKELTPSERIQINQREKLRGFMKGILDLFGKYINTPFQIPNLLKQLIQTKEFNSFTERLGLRFVNEVKVWNEYAFKEYMKTSYAEKSRNIFLHLNKDDEFQKFIQKQAEERANLFKRIPVSLAEHLTPKISKWSIEGMTSKEVAHKLRSDIPNLLESQVKTIARTETSKTLIAITGYKCQKNNIPCYQWKASGGYRGDGRTRNSHRHMSDVIIFWNDPPAPEDLFPTGYKNTLGHYHAGCCPNCRCSASPLVFIEDLKFPVRVYTNGKIVSMDRTSFLKLYNGKIAELKAEKRPKEQAKITQIKKSPEELQKEKKAKEEERFLNEQRAKVNRLVSEINFYLKQINIIEESLQNQTDRKIIKAETDKINKYSKIIQKYKQELEKINNSIIIADSVVTDSVIKDSNIIKYLIEKAKYLKEFIIETIKNIFNLNNITYLNEDYNYINENELEELKKTAGNATKEEIEHITGYIGSRQGYIKTGYSWIINQKIRHGKESDSNEHDRETIRILKKLTTTNYTNQNLILDRYVDKGRNQGFLKKFKLNYYNRRNGEEIVKILNSNFKDFIFSNDNFISASYNSKRNNFKDDRIVKLKILTPAGTNLYLTENIEESEVIFPIGVKFQHINSKLVYINGIEQIEITVKVVK